MKSKIKSMFKVKWVKFLPHKCLLPDVMLNEGVNKLTRRKHFLRQKFLWTLLEMSVCRKCKHYSQGFICFIFILCKWKWFDSQCGSAFGAEIHIVFLQMFIGLLEYFDLLSSVYNSNIVWFSIFCLSSTSKNALGNFSPSRF